MCVLAFPNVFTEIKGSLMFGAEDAPTKVVPPPGDSASPDPHPIPFLLGNLQVALAFRWSQTLGKTTTVHYGTGILE